MKLSNEEGLVLPGYSKPASSWSDLDRASFAAGYLMSVMQACNLAIVRQHGIDGYVDRDVQLIRSQQRTHFAEGCRRLGITAEPDAVLSAKYHAMSNALGGLRMRYAVESDDKAWIFYLPLSGRVEAALESDAHALADFSNWHAQNGAVLGNPGLVFVVTHAYSRGDYYNAGYWLDTGNPVPPEPVPSLLGGAST